MQEGVGETGATRPEGMTMAERDERAVAPVVGIALLIGITAILAAVVGSVIFGLSVDPGDSPQATLSFSVDNSTDTVVLRHEGGETLDADEVVVKNESAVIYELGSDLNTGARRTTGIEVNDHDEISVVWQDPASSAENVLATFEP